MKNRKVHKYFPIQASNVLPILNLLIKTPLTSVTEIEIQNTPYVTRFLKLNCPLFCSKRNEEFYIQLIQKHTLHS